MHSFRSQLHLGSFLNEIVPINSCVFFCCCRCLVRFGLVRFGKLCTSHVFSPQIFTKSKRNRTVYAREQMKSTESIHTKKKHTHHSNHEKKEIIVSHRIVSFSWGPSRASLSQVLVRSLLTARSFSFSISCAHKRYVYLVYDAAIRIAQR